MIRSGIFIIFSLLIAFPKSALPFCDEAEAQRVEDTDPSQLSWNDLHNIYEKLGRACDDGGFAEWLDSAVMKTLFSHWKSLSQLRRQTDTDKEYLRFIQNHITVLETEKDLKKLASLARNECPEKSSAELCQTIADTANQALEDIKAGRY